VLVFLNRRASYGRAASRWETVRPALEKRAGEFDVEEVGSPESVAGSIGHALARGERTFVAAGGDGTVNLLVNAIMMLDGGDLARPDDGGGPDAREATGDPQDGPGIALGAVGLGSSNDFHKPFGRDSVVAGVPVRIDHSNARPCDIIEIDLEDDEGNRARRYAIINASLGITAEANASFNAPGAFVRAARKFSVDAAIVASVLGTVASYRDIGCSLTLDGSYTGDFSVSNLAVIKNPHFGGSFCYDTPIAPDDGQLGINLCERLTPLQALATLAALRKHRFLGRPKTRSWIGTRVSVRGDRTFALETDGEVVRARSAEFGVIPKAIRCCQ
jgi:diacylglycerol kinase family enzyme